MTIYTVTNQDTQQSQDYPNIVAGFRPVSLLPVPYVSQLGPGAEEHRNDCGAACGVMLVKTYFPENNVTVNVFYNTCNPQGDVYLSASQIISALAVNNVRSTWEENQDLDKLFDLLRNGQPAIALINYGVLVQANLTEKIDFTGAHFITVIGMDNHYVYIHDPYSTGKNGESRPIPIAKFLEAWGHCSEQSNPNHAIVIAERSVFEPHYVPPVGVYRIRVKATFLTVRKGPSANFSPVNYLKKNAECDIYREQNDWGEIALDQWISLSPSYVVRI